MCIYYEVIFVVSSFSQESGEASGSLSCKISFQGNTVVICYFPLFMAKIKSVSNPCPWFVMVKPLADCVGHDEEENLFGPVRVEILSVYNKRVHSKVWVIVCTSLFPQEVFVYFC